MGQSSSLADLKRLLVAAARADVIGDEVDIGCARATSEGRFHVQIENHVTEDPIVSIYTSQGDIFRGSTSTLIAKSAKNLQPRKGRPPKINVESWETSLGVFKAEDDNGETWTKFSVILSELDDEDLYPLHSADSASDKEVDGGEDTSKPTVRTPNLGGSESRLRLESIVFSTFPAVGDYVEISPSGKSSLKGSAGKVVNIGDQSNPEKRRVQLLIGNKPTWVTLRLGDFRLIDGSQVRDEQARDDRATPKLSLDPAPNEQDKPSPAISDVKLDPGRPQTLKAKLMKMWSEKKVKKQVDRAPGDTQATSPGPVETVAVKREKTVHSEDSAAQMHSKLAVSDKSASKSSNSTKRKKKKRDVRSAHSLQSHRKAVEPSEKPASRGSDSNFPDDKRSSDSSSEESYLEDGGSERVEQWRRTRGSPERGRKKSHGPTIKDADERSTSEKEPARPAPRKSEKKKPVRQKGWREIRGLFTDVVVQKNEESESDEEDSENEESSPEEASPVLSTSRLRKAKLSSTERGPRGRTRRTEDATVSEDVGKSASVRSRSRRREETEVEPEASSKASAKSEKKDEAKRSPDIKRPTRTHGKVIGKAVDALEADVKATGDSDVQKIPTKQPGKGSKRTIRKQNNSEEEDVSPPGEVRSEVKSSKRQNSGTERAVTYGAIASVDSKENAEEKSQIETAAKGSPKAVKQAVKVPSLKQLAEEDESEVEQSFIEILAGYDFKDISDSMSFFGDEVILDVTGLKVKLVDYISKCCLKIAHPDSQIEVEDQLPLLGSDELSEFLASLTFVLDGSLSIAPEFSKRWCSRKGLNSQVVGFALSIVDAALKAALELKAKLDEKKDVKDPALGEASGDQVEVTSTGPFQNAINAFVVLVNYLEYEDKTIGDAEDAGPEDRKLATVVHLAERPELLEMVSPTMTLMELPKLKALKGPSSKLRQWASEYILCLLGTRALSDVERNDVIHRIVEHENIFSSFVDELQKRMVRIDERARGTDETVADVLYELLENKEFLIRLADPEENETREKLADAFTSSFEKIVSGRPAGIVNNEINLKVLDAVTLFFKYAFLRGHVVGNSHLRSKFMTAFAALLARTDEIIADVTGNSKNPVKMDPFDGYEVDEIIEDELIDEDIAWFLSISFRIFGVLGNRIGGGSLLSHLIESQFRGRRGLERLYTFAWKLQRSVGTEKLGEKDRTLFTVAFTAVQEAMESAHFSSRRQNPAVNDSADVTTRSDGYDVLGISTSDGSDTEIPRKLGTLEKVEPIRLRSLLQYPKRRREFEVVDAELSEFYREEMEAAFIRLTGSGEKPAPFKRLSKNEYLPAARKLLQSQGEHIMQCNCVEVPGAMACNDHRCLNRASMFECDEQHCQAGESCSNQRFQKRQYVPVKVTKAEGGKGWGLKPLEDVEKGTFVMEYQGQVIDEDDYERRKKRYEGEKNFYFMNLTPDLYLDASRKGNLARFINHSCDPNCATQKWTVSGEPCVGIFAVKDIPKGCEITFDYNIESGARGETSAAVKCECGAPNCKVWLTGKEDTPEIRKAAEEQYLRRAKVVEDQLKWINNRIELRARGRADEPSSLSEGEDMDLSDEKLSTGMGETEDNPENPQGSPSRSPGKRDRRVAFPGMYSGTDDVLPSIRIKKRTVGNGQASPELTKVETKEPTPLESMKKEETPLELPNKELAIVKPATAGILDDMVVRTEMKPKPSEFPAIGTTSQGRKSAFVETSSAGESNRESNIVEKTTADSIPIVPPAPPPVVESKDVAAHAGFIRVDASGKEESSLVSEGTKLLKDVMRNDGKPDFIDESDNRDAMSGTIKTISVSESKEGLRVPGSPKRVRSETSELKDSNLTSDRKRVWQTRDRSPGQRRESPPYKRREVSPYDRRELSPYERRELSPYIGREASPYKRRELSPRERRYPSPRHVRGAIQAAQEGRTEGCVHARGPRRARCLDHVRILARVHDQAEDASRGVTGQGPVLLFPEDIATAPGGDGKIVTMTTTGAIAQAPVPTEKEAHMTDLVITGGVTGGTAIIDKAGGYYLQQGLQQRSQQQVGEQRINE
ncbi:hypothetical protein NDN08_008285 [Rhodosorus marinus]|uniref:Calmodulin n=1 Tax=Rhodosorus marinus TaxID=101924 RepID=A0AAV8V2S7_9RHOD|nr:hypothetical protein NDN08_008285 [Rhodosorus marinus]